MWEGTQLGVVVQVFLSAAGGGEKFEIAGSAMAETLDLLKTAWAEAHRGWGEILEGVHSQTQLPLGLGSQGLIMGFVFGFCFVCSFGGFLLCGDTQRSSRGTAGDAAGVAS